MIESLKTLIAYALKNECAAYFAPVESALSSPYDNTQPLQIYAQEILNAHLYPLTAHGKLIRPLLVLLTAGSIGGKNAVQNALPAALAVECVHTYSLVHDDLPCMDNDILRRGKPTTHVVYGDAKALLVGDGLLTAAFEILAHASTATDVSSPGADRGLQNLTKLKLIKCLSKAIGTRGMIFGQWLDISESKFSQSDLLNASSAKWEIFHTLHKNKTGKLFGACFEMGLLSGVESSSKEKEDKLYSEEYIENIQKQIFQIGLDIGLSFQIFDDILDATQDSKTLGKTAGKDAMQNKLTAVKILGLKEAHQYADESLKNAIENLQDLINKDFENILQKNEEYFSALLKLLRSVNCHPPICPAPLA